MAPKRASLFGRLAEASKEAPSSQLPSLETPTPQFPAVLPKQDRPPSRQGKKIVSMFVSPEASKQLRMLALKNDTTVQALMVEALNDLFAKNGANRIAE